jgi:hypothetical protein
MEKPTNIFKKSLLFIMCFFILSHMWLNDLRAEGDDIHWTAPYLLSGIEGSIIYTAIDICSDKFGNVHVLWGERVYPNEITTINYSRFNGEIWTQSNDIYVAPQGRSVHNLSVFIGYSDTIHVVWSEGNRGPVYYSKAPVIDAVSALNWSDPAEINIPAHQFKLLVDSKGVLHLLYSILAGDDRGVYYIASSTFGDSWSSPVWLDPDIPSEFIPISIQFEIDETDDIHAVWEYADSSVEGYPSRWVRYAHSLDGDINWSNSITIDIDDDNSGKIHMARPVLSVVNRRVLVVWAGDYRVRKIMRVSENAGVSWKSPISIFEELNGQANDDLILDPSGRVHFFGQMRYPMGIYHSYWEENRWSIPSMIYFIQQNHASPRDERIHAHSVKAASPDENQLVIIFTNSPDESQLSLYTMHQNQIGISTPTVTENIQIASTPAETVVLSLKTTTTTPNRFPEISYDDEFKSSINDSHLGSVMGIIWGILPVFILLVVLFIFRLKIIR